MVQNIQQRRAKYALERIQDINDDENIPNQKFLSYVTSFPAMIYMNGLGQAAAFCCSKVSKKKEEGKAYYALYKIVSDWLCKESGIYEGSEHMLNGITQGDMQTYRMAQAEALCLLEWARKFALAYLDEEPQENSSGS